MHDWQFFRAGGFSQVSLGRGSDFAALPELDQKLWTALACPVDSIEFDRTTLALIDADGDGRVRAPELLAVLDWTLQRLVGPDELFDSTDTLPLAAVNREHPGGAAIVDAARRVLREMERADAASIDLAAANGAAELLATRPLNGDGVVIPESTPDPELRSALEILIACGFAVTDRSGASGVDGEGLKAFFDAAQALQAWRAEAGQDPALLAAGAGTAAAAAAVAAVVGKVDDYFARCALVRFDPRAEAALNREEEAWLALAARDLGIDREEVRAFPLSRVDARGVLALGSGINPAWTDAVAALRESAVVPLIGGSGDELLEADWRALCLQLAPFGAWQARKPGAALDGLDDAQLAQLLRPAVRADLEALVAADLELEPAFSALTDLIKLIRLRRDIASFCRNFVNFQDFYGTETKASFQFGTLFIDQRSCTLCLKVSDAARHATLAGMAGMYLAYCDCVRPATGQKMQIVAAITDGDSENLLVGRNGVFYDREGNDWDATVARIVDNPISVRQAFWSPYKKVARFIEQQVAKRAATADAAAGQKLEGAATALPVPAAAGPAAAVPARRVDVGTVAAIGVALGSLGTAFGYFLKTVADIKAWQFPLLLLGIMLAISGPSMVLAWLKLRRRNLAPLLDASGWAVNARVLINVPFGATLTAIAALPAGARSIGGDRFAAQGGFLPRLLLVLFLVWWLLAFLSDQGYLEKLLMG